MRKQVVGRLGAILSTYAGAWALELGGNALFFTLVAVAMLAVSVSLAVIGRAAAGTGLRGFSTSSDRYVTRWLQADHTDIVERGMNSSARLRRSLGIASLALLAIIGRSSGPEAAPPGVKSAASGSDEVYDYLVFSDAVAGKEDEYNRWYDTQHAPDVVAVPGFVTAQRLVAADAQLRKTAPPTKYLVVYQIVTNDLAAVNREVVRRIQTGQTVMSPAFDGTASAPNGIFKAMGPVFEHPGWTPGGSEASTYYQLVFVNPVPGQDRELNTWYDGQHLLDMVAMPGFVT
jgi:hypothetical protein